VTVSEGDLWIFGYGSLMWDPGFAFEAAQPALLTGYHRSLCVLSIRNRGTADRPGLALGLARGGACRGMAFRVAADSVPAARAYLWQREMATDAYAPRLLSVRLLGEGGGRRVPALVFVSRSDHPQYCGDLLPEDAARLVAQGKGLFGTALDYLRETVRHLNACGVRDGPLHRILALAEQLAREEAQRAATG
jgi:cation transport protein ChaC